MHNPRFLNLASSPLLSSLYPLHLVVGGLHFARIHWLDYTPQSMIATLEADVPRRPMMSAFYQSEHRKMLALFLPE